MKIKALRYKKEFNPYQEFVHLYINGQLGICDVLTGELPEPRPVTATMEGIVSYYESKNVDLDWDRFELVELDLIESGEVGADIRNKLGNYNNLVSLVQDFLEETNPDTKKIMKELIWAEIRLGKETVEYLAKLF